MTDAPERHAHTEAYRRGDHSTEALMREIEAERQNVSATIEALQEKFTVGNIVNEAWDHYGDHANELGHDIRQVIARNPLPVMLTTVGLAWLVMSARHDGTRDPMARDPKDHARPLGADEELDQEDIMAKDPNDGDARRPYGTAAMAGYYKPRRSVKDRVTGAASAAYEAAEDAIDPALHRIGKAGEAVASRIRDAAGGSKHGAPDAAHHTDHAHGAKSTAREFAESAAEKGREAIETVGDTARRGMREAAERTDHYRREGRRQAEHMMRDHPLIVGAAALAIGAGIGCLLPRSRAEDEHFGRYSDQIRHMAVEEAEKARRVASAVADEARDIAGEEYDALKGEFRAMDQDIRHELSDTAAELREKAEDGAENVLHEAKSEAGEIASRLGDTAREEAERQGLGDLDRSI